MRFFLIVFVVLFSLFSCKSDDIKKVDVSKVDIAFSVDRFDVDFYTANKESLHKVKDKYPFFFPYQITDSLSLSKIADKDEQELFTETQKVYKDFSSVEKKLFLLFKHVKYYNPKFKSPKVITMLTNIDYENRITYADSLLIISLDAYLGNNHKFYSDFPNYIKENNTKEHIIVDVANTIINKQVSPFKNRSFISKMIYEGKKMYLLDLYLPLISDKEKIGFEQDKLEWANANEEQIWKYFIDKKLLFSTDTKLNKRFIETAPFSKFYMEHDNLSPGRIGVWIGWKIVKSYMKHNDVSLQELLKTSETDLLKKSKYKPKK
ncbi:gliding motility lipoprotein GldB [Polaribacter sp. SA4-10]|uniref:gliding motility lipoprotein GldB n=1 Tax=Polaribacter sp. SA4-10 TaxID=754397 RepID=UPI000B3BE3FB|nr:gliding motility lipoprotein GldB [Polaribacter sp. SA4-10]ARV06714.1 gliding motility lipoprotein GldB [Polaribacter sp. SA4-10]